MYVLILTQQVMLAELLWTGSTRLRIELSDTGRLPGAPMIAGSPTTLSDLRYAISLVPLIPAGFGLPLFLPPATVAVPSSATVAAWPRPETPTWEPRRTAPRPARSCPSSPSIPPRGTTAIPGDGSSHTAASRWCRPANQTQTQVLICCQMRILEDYSSRGSLAFGNI